MSLSPRRLLAVVAKELRHITHDARIFFLVTLSPAFLLFVLAYVFAFDVGNVNLGWLDGDRTATSRAYLAAITADGMFRVAENATSYEELETALLAGRVDIALIVPPGFERQLARGATDAAGRPVMVQALADGTDAILAAQELGNLSARTAAFGVWLAGRPLRIEARTRAWYNPDLKSLRGMAPGLLAIVLTLPALALTLAVTREKEVGTLEALIAAPVRGPGFLLGNLLAYVLSGLVSASAAAAVAVLWFGVPFRGSFWLYLALAVDFYLACMGVSLLIAQFVRSQQTAMLLVLFVFFVSGFFVSGLIAPVNTASVQSLLVS
jgi:ABC-2 type transport system permease protein